MKADEHVVINVSGRGDKDIFNIASALKDTTFNDFLRDYLATEESGAGESGAGGHH